MSRVLLTGASGFVGQHVLRSLLSSKADIIAVSRSRPDVQGEYTWIQTDLLSDSTERLFRNSGVSHVLHTAWFVEYGKFWNDPSNVLWRDSTIALAKTAAANGVRRFVGLGTCYEFEWPANADCDEDLTPTAHHTPYDRAKDETRQAIEMLAVQQELSFCWARLFFPFGPGESAARLIPHICKSIANDKPADCSSGSAIRDFIFVQDAANLLNELVVSDITGNVNIASGHATSVADIATAIGRISGRRDLVRLGALPDRKDEPPRITAKIGRARLLQAFSSMPTLEKRLTETYERWKHQAEKA